MRTVYGDGEFIGKTGNYLSCFTDFSLLYAKMIGAVCFGKVGISALYDENVRSAVKWIRSVNVKGIFSDLLAVDLDYYARALLLRKIYANKENEGYGNYCADQDIILFLHFRSSGERARSCLP